MSGEWGRARVRATWEGSSWPVCGSPSPFRHHTFQTPYPSWVRGPPRVQNLLLVTSQIPKESLFSSNLFVVIRERFGYPQTHLFGKKKFQVWFIVIRYLFRLYFLAWVILSFLALLKYDWWIKIVHAEGVQCNVNLLCVMMIKIINMPNTWVTICVWGCVCVCVCVGVCI